MAKNLADFVKSVNPAGTSSGPSEIVCRANVWEFWGTGAKTTYFNGPGAQGCAYCRTCAIFCVPSVNVKPNNGGEAIADGNPNKAKFEIWGAGGVGTGMCNCGISPPTGAGAYAYKTIDVTAGQCYYVHIGYSWCCLPPNGGSNTVRSTECRATSFYTYVTGTGLDNFCAESGRGGEFLCCNFNATAFDSDGAKFWTLDSHYGTGAEAQYYGADGGATGKLGWIEKKPCAPADNALSYVQWVPYPGGLVDQKGGHVLLPTAVWGHAGNLCCTSDYATCMVGAMYGMGQGKMTTHYRAGQGLPGNHLCGGGAHCGDANMPGRVKITFWRE